ncbi:hypothetical protein FGIG_10383 [Fasciola gigantica]|uniref:Uncharacterized protein n=1 Tax=Fasciola gigantica TaxID=46835 RepID=A0A504Y7L0_FASGI|nr:hypothetical protein FGIG_10383 [Fasciola gigantica]
MNWTHRWHENPTVSALAETMQYGGVPDSELPLHGHSVYRMDKSDRRQGSCAALYIQSDMPARRHIVFADVEGSGKILKWRVRLYSSGYVPMGLRIQGCREQTLRLLCDELWWRGREGHRIILGDFIVTPSDRDEGRCSLPADSFTLAFPHGL